MKSIRLRKSIMVEGKIISKGARILVENEDVEDVGVPMNPSDNIEDDVDVAKARRLAKIRRIRALKAKKLEGDNEVIDTDENLKPEEFPADEIQAMKRAKLAKLRKAKKAETEDEVTEEDETDEVTEEDTEIVDEKKKALRRARLARIRNAKKAEDEEETTEEIEEDDDSEDELVASKCK